MAYAANCHIVSHVAQSRSNMQFNSYQFSIPIALAIGVIHAILLTMVWALALVYISPIPFLADLGLSRISIHTVVWIKDMLINILLSFPAAFLITRLRPRNLPLYVFVAVIPMFMWQYRGVFIAEASPIANWIAYFPGMAMTLLMLPLALAVLAWFSNTRGPNNVFKRKAATNE